LITALNNTTAAINGDAADKTSSNTPTSSSNGKSTPIVDSNGTVRGYVKPKSDATPTYSNPIGPQPAGADVNLVDNVEQFNHYVKQAGITQIEAAAKAAGIEMNAAEAERAYELQTKAKAAGIEMNAEEAASMYEFQMETKGSI
jgi:hypothetical protein